MKTSCFETLVMGHWPFKSWQERQRCHLISSGSFTKHLKCCPSTEVQRLHQWLAVGDESLAAKMFDFVSWIFLIQPEVFGLTWISWMQTSSKAPWRTTWRFPRGVRTFNLYLMSPLQPPVWGKHEPSPSSALHNQVFVMYCYIDIRNGGLIKALVLIQKKPKPILWRLPSALALPTAVSLALQISSQTILVKQLL